MPILTKPQSYWAVRGGGNDFGNITRFNLGTDLPQDVPGILPILGLAETDEELDKVVQRAGRNMMEDIARMHDAAGVLGKGVTEMGILRCDGISKWILDGIMPFRLSQNTN
ncbi:hypothetical protein EYC84_002793 [Monilinia fructicola]|uniref:Uncharacterized protein n=1 Tax=Monilinia fructicola TaxID=38448 RepID=A0A5M9JUK9_MONFR|nr:hypothetical protein EYC84_002793 [Monilinia fructicola]